MIPNDIVTRMNSQPGDVRRPDADEAERQLVALGFSVRSEIVEFFREYTATGIISDSSEEELLDPAIPTAQLKAVTDFVRETYDVPQEYVCLSSAEGEGFFLTNTQTGAIFDVAVEDLDTLEQGRKKPRWRSFYDFMRWYLSV